MSQETTDNFWQAMREFKWPESVAVFYRLYYNKDGSPIVYSMEELPGNYIEVDRLSYQLADMNVRVVGGAIVKFNRPKINKLVPAAQGTHCHPKDVCVIVDQSNYRAWSYQ